MKPQLFRQDALDRIATPDSLDELLRVASAKQGATLAAALLLSAAMALWAWFGTVTTTSDGRAVLMRAATPARVQPEQGALEAMAYIPASQAKLVRAGMQAKLSPSTVEKERYGYLRATVVSVSAFPLNPTALMRRFENESLTAAVAADGPVTEVLLALQPDPGSFTGYRWSSSKGPRALLSNGTLCDVRIIIDEQRPFRLILPRWKERPGAS